MQVHGVPTAWLTVLLLRFDNVWAVPPGHSSAPSVAACIKFALLLLGVYTASTYRLLAQSLAFSLPFSLTVRIISYFYSLLAAETYDCVRHLETMGMAGVIDSPSQPVRCARL